MLTFVTCERQDTELKLLRSLVKAEFRTPGAAGAALAASPEAGTGACRR